MRNIIFVVNKEPYCLWDIDVHDRNNEFLNGIDTEYLDYILNVHLEADDEKRATVALKSALHHALETMFSLIGAYIQAPNCSYAWIAKCSNNDLRQLISQIGDFNNDIYTVLNIEEITWESISNCIFKCYKPESDRNKQTTKLFAKLWQSLAHEYIDKNNTDEYNSIKHGFRVRSGGFTLAMGLEHDYGVPPPEDEMKVIGSSEHGVTFFKIETIGSQKGNRSIRSRRTSTNWTVENIALLIQLVSMSINNLVSALKIVNGAKAGTCKFLRPEEDTDFDKPWEHIPGITNCNMDIVINENDVATTTRKELLNKINEHKKANK